MREREHIKPGIQEADSEEEWRIGMSSRETVKGSESHVHRLVVGVLDRRGRRWRGGRETRVHAGLGQVFA